MTRSTRRRFVKSSLALIFMILSAPGGSTADGFNAGFAATDITPPVGWRRAGNYTEFISTGVHDPLFAKATVLSQGKTTVAFVGNDLCSVPRELTDRARKRASEKTGIPFANIVITATHTHGAPEYYGPLRDFLHARALNENGGKDPREPIDFHALLVERWTEVIVKAHAARQPVTLSVVVPQQEGLAFNRRFLLKGGSTGWNPGKRNTNIARPLGPTDPDLPFVLVREAATDKPLALGIAMSAPFVAKRGEPFTVSFFVKGDKQGTVEVGMPPSAREVGQKSKRL